MSSVQGYSSQELQQLILNAATYMTKIQSFSNKIANSRVNIFECLQQAVDILGDNSTPLLKKLIVLRFIKDTLLLASLAFYLGVVIMILPWLIKSYRLVQLKQQQSRPLLIGKLLRGQKQLNSSDINICKTILQLIEELIKWMGIIAQEHPYSKIKYTSAFKTTLSRCPQIQSLRQIDLTFFKSDDPNKYQAYYLERESSEAEGERLGQYLRECMPDVERGQYIQTLQWLVETGDGYVIGQLIDQLYGRIQALNVSTIGVSMFLLEQLHRLMAVGDIQFCNLAKNQLLDKVTMSIQMLYKHNTQSGNGEGSSAPKAISLLKCWHRKCQQLSLPCQAFIQCYKLLQREGIDLQDVVSTELTYSSILQMTKQINKQKLPQLKLQQKSIIQRIKNSKYIPIYESNPPKWNQHSIVSIDPQINKLPDNKNIIKQSPSSPSQNQLRSESRHDASHSSNHSFNKKDFLQAYSKVPQIQIQNLLKDGVSEMNEIQLQHSNLSQRFHSNQLSKKALIMSFKKPQISQDNYSKKSPQVIFSDSFTSNQKNSPIQKAIYEQLIDVIQEPSQQYGRRSQPSSVNRNILFQNTVQKNIKYLRQSTKSNKASSSKDKQFKFSKIDKEQNNQNIKKANNINDYQMEVPQNNSSLQSKQSKTVKQKIQKSSSIARSKDKKFLKKISKDKQISPFSKVSHTKSINILQFNQVGGKGDKLSSNPKYGQKPPVESILVEKTIRKPKFGFKIEEENSNIAADTITVDESQSAHLYSLSLTDSLSFDPSLEQMGSNNTIPQNFADLLRAKPEKVKINGYDHKAKQLEKQISRLKQKKQKIEKEVITKNQVIAQLKKQMPASKDQLQQENMQLKRAIHLKKHKSAESVFKVEPGHQFNGIIAHISSKSLPDYLKKQLLYSKCRILKSQELQIGFQVKNKQMSLYFTFLKDAEQCWMRIEQNSLNLSQEIDAKIYKISQGKQIKFKSLIKDFRMFGGDLDFAKLKVDIKLSSKNIKTFQIIIPFYFYNMLTFDTPTCKVALKKITDWHYCCQSLLDNPHYLKDYFPRGVSEQNTYLMKIQLQEQVTYMRIVIQLDKFAIQYMGVEQQFELKVLKSIMGLLQQSKQQKR